MKSQSCKSVFSHWEILRLMKLELASSLCMNNGDISAVKSLEVLNKSLKAVEFSGVENDMTKKRWIDDRFLYSEIFFIFIFLESSTVCQILLWRLDVQLLLLLGRQTLFHLILVWRHLFISSPNHKSSWLSSQAENSHFYIGVFPKVVLSVYKKQFLSSSEHFTFTQSAYSILILTKVALKLFEMACFVCCERVATCFPKNSLFVFPCECLFFIFGKKICSLLRIIRTE